MRLLEQDFDPLSMLRQSMSKGTPWESIVDFAVNEDFCGQVLYPRQQTLLRLIYLETDHMTAYDLDVIEEWRQGFTRSQNVFGVQPDIWERVEYLKHRGYRRFPHIQAVLGRRASKGFLGAILAAEQIAYLITLDNPQKHFSIREGKDVFLNVGATSQTQAQRHQFADIRDVVEKCVWLQPYIAETKDHQMRLRTPADLRRIAAMKAQNVPIEHTIASLWCVALSASSVAGRGATSYANFFDEFAFHVQGSGSTKSGEEIYEDWQPSLGQFKKDALTYVPSSPFSKVGKFYELYQQGKILMSSYRDTEGVSEEAQAELITMRSKADLDEVELSADPTKLIFQGPSWVVYEDWERGPELVSVEFGAAPEDDLRSEDQQRRQLQNPEKFAVERLGQFAEVLGQYLDAAKVDAMFAPVSWREPAELTPTPFGRFDYTYRIHVDPSTVGANFALCIAHTEEAPLDQFGERWPHVIIDRLHVWRARDFPVNPETGKHEIDYTAVERELDAILYAFPSTSKFSSDQFHATGFLQRLRRKYAPGIRVLEVTATEKSNWEVAEKFKAALNLGWVHCLEGETRVLTPGGLRPIRELAGSTYKVLTPSTINGRGGGKWVDAHFSSYGVAPLMKIVLRRNGVEKVIHATPNHRWFVRRDRGTGHYRDEVLTENLQPGQRLSYCHAQRHRATRPSPIGIAHGFTYGDGTRSRKGSVAQFCGDKDKALIPYFDLHPIVDIAPGVRRAHDLPRFFKEKVDLTESPSYLYGWLAGYMAADGHVTKDGQVEIDSNDRASLEHVRMVCNLLGIHTASIRTKSSYGHGYSDNDGYAVSLERSSLTEDFFLIEEHRQRWTDNQDKQVKDYRGYTVVSVEQTNRVEEVFCAEVPETHSFTLEDNILTGNSYNDNLASGDMGSTSLLELECKFLSEKNHKVYKQEFGPVQTKDLYDAVSVVTTDLLHEALERYSGGQLTASSYGSTNSRDLRSGRAAERAMETAGNRYIAGHHGQGKAWDALRSFQGDRARAQAQGTRTYQPDRTRRIDRGGRR